MKKSLKQTLALLLALIMLFAMSLPTGLIAGAVDADNDGVEDEIVTPDEGDEDVTPDEPDAPVEPERTTVTDLPGDVTFKVNVNSIVGTAEPIVAEEAVGNLFSNLLSNKYCATVDLAASPLVEISWAMAEEVAVQSYALTSAADSAGFSGRDPKEWTFYGSKDGAEWVALDSQVGQGFAVNGMTKVYPFENTEAYKYYKLTVEKNNAEIIFQLCAIQLSTEKLDDLDANAAAAAAADAFKKKLAAFEALDFDEQLEQMAALRAEYDALDMVAKAKVGSIKALTDAETYETKQVLATKLVDLVAEIDAAMEAGPDEFTGQYDYHLNGKITDALALAKDLGAAAADIDTEKLEGYRKTLDEALNVNFTTAVGTISTAGAAKNPWLETMTEEDIEATKQAVVDELTYQYTRAGYLLGTGYIGGTVNLDAGWGSMLLSQQEAADGVTSPWKDQPARMWSCLMVPFAGMAFSATGYMGGSDAGFTVLSDNFIYNGRVYQQRWDNLTSYAYGYEAPYIDNDANNALNPELRQEVSYPGYNGVGDATNNTFRYAYAKYASDNKMDGKVLGIPSGNIVENEDVIYQAFEGPDGMAYIAGSASAIAAVDANNPEEKAFAIYGDILTAIMGEDDFETAIAATGAPITAVDKNGIQMFENGVATKDGFEAYSADNEYLKVITLIDGLPTSITRENLDAVAASIESAKAAYDALTANKDKVENADKLDELEKEYNTFKADITAADAVAELINKIPATVTMDDQATIEAARKAYDELTENQQTLIDASRLIAAENNIVKLIDAQKTAEVEALIDALPEDEDIDGADFEKNAALVEAANDAYEALTAKQQNDVSTDRYEALMQKLDIVDAGGYTKWAATIDGDVDGNGKVDVTDIIKIKNLIMTEVNTPEELNAGDLNNSGTLDVGDIMGIKAIIMGA